MCSFLATYPHLSGTVFDLPEVIAEKDQLWAGRLGLEERCRYVAGDMFKEVPGGADVYSLEMILHDWSDRECLQILRTIRRAKPEGRIFIVEHIVPGPSESHFSKLFDIHMMCWGSGRERTEKEYASLLEASGWRFVAMSRIQDWFNTGWTHARNSPPSHARPLSSSIRFIARRTTSSHAAPARCIWETSVLTLFVWRSLNRHGKPR
jgi:hypothetical protein